MAGRSILHVDMDAFFASVEQREDPRLAGRPVIVGADPRGGRGRGVVAACSYEARRFGIHSAMPISQAFRRCPQGVYLPPRGALYQQVSREVMQLLQRFSDLVEPISIDEAFLDVTGSTLLFGPPRAIAESIREAVRTEQRLTCSIGIAPNKFLAKVASDLNKPDGVTVVPEGAERRFLAPLPVRCIWGVGPRTEEKLARLGVRNIGDIWSRPRQFWCERFGKHGLHLWNLSQGHDTRLVQPHSGFKSLSHERTFGRDTDDLKHLEATILSLAEAVAKRLRNNGVGGRGVTLKWRWADFTSLTRQTTLPHPTDDARTIYQACLRLLRKLLPLEQKVRLVGVAVGRLEAPDRDGQPELFGEQAGRKRKLDESVDAIQRKFGRGIIKKARLLEHTDDEPRFSTFLEN